jgi:hypothetical protein
VLRNLKRTATAHVPLQPRSSAGAAAGGRRALPRLRERRAQPAEDGPDRLAGATVGGGVRHLARGLAAEREIRGCESVRGEGAVRQGGAPVAGPLLPAARRARRRGGRVHGRADPDQRLAVPYASYRGSPRTFDGINSAAVGGR